MTDEMKLLRAFIEASGYEIEKIIDHTETPISKQSGLNRIVTFSASGLDVLGLVIDSSGAYKRGGDECYYLKPSLNVDFEVTKKGE